MRKLFVVALTVAACGGGHSAAKTPHLSNVAPVHAKLSGYVLVPRGITLRDRAGEDGQHVRAYDSDPADPANLGDDWVMQAVGEEGEYVEVENVRTPDLEPHCYDAISGLDGLHLRLWLRADELRAETTHEARVDYPDGTSIVLGGGVAVLRSGATDNAGRPIVTARVDGLVITAALPPDAIGTTYQPSAHLQGKDDATDYLGASPPKQPLGLGDDPRLGVSGWPATQGLYDIVPRGAVRLATIRSNCAAVRVRVPDEQLGGAGVGYGHGGGYGVSDATYVDAGAVLTWPDGRDAGVVVEQTLVEGGFIGDHGDRNCFAQPLRSREERVDDDGPPKPRESITICAKNDQFSGGGKIHEPPLP